MSEYPSLMTIEDVGRELSRSRTWVFEMIRNGELQAVKAGAATRIKGESLKAYIEGLPPARVFGKPVESGFKHRPTRPPKNDGAAK
jgi:excisionase family DNA binding protein